MKSLLELIKLLYGPKALSQTIGTRTNVIRLPNNKIKKYIKQELNIEEASDAAVQNAYKEMEELVAEIPKMNDGERLIFEGNLRRTKNKLQSMGVIPPDETAEIISMTAKQPVSKEGIEQLIEEAGQTSRPGTLMGDLESRINRLKTLSKDQGITMDDILKDAGKAQTSMINQQREGLVRSTARQILYSDIKSGKLKVSKEVQDIVSGKASGDPIDSFRTIYGEDALEQLDSLTPDLRQLRTEIDAEKLARSKFEFTPKLDRPKESYTPEEMEKILKEGEEETKGLDYLTGQEPPEKKANGGRIGYAEGTPMAGLVYVGSWEGPWTGPEFLGGPRKGQYYQSSPIRSITGLDGAIPRPGMPMMSAPRPEVTSQIDSIKEAMMSLPQTRSNPRMNAMRRFNQVQDPRMMRLMQMLRRQPAAMGGIMNLKMGGTPVEMDLRAKGGFVPIGKKERADDVPARLSKNEFVFTAKAVRNAGSGDIREGAKRMYNLMNRLEAKR